MPIAPWTILFTLSLSAASALGCSPVSETREAIVPLAKIEALRVKNPHGRVTVRRADREGVRVVATLVAQDGARLAASHVIVQSTPDEAELFVAWAGDEVLMGESADLVIEVPRWSGVRIETDDGLLEVVALDEPSEPLAGW